MTHSGLAIVIVIAFFAILVLIPLLLDDPLWDDMKAKRTTQIMAVLIPLLLDDPLWERIYLLS